MNAVENPNISLEMVRIFAVYYVKRLSNGSMLANMKEENGKGVLSNEQTLYNRGNAETGR
jgi:hypothetical protein